MKWILQLNPSFPKIVKISEDLKDLIIRCLDKDPEKRIGYNDTSEIMKHPWFADVNWEKVNNLELEVPIKMDIKDKMDTEYFDVTDKKPELQNLKDID